MPDNATTTEQTVSKALTAIIEEAKRIEENCLFSSKGHFIASRCWDNFNVWMGLPTIILAAVSVALAFTSVFLLAGILSTIVVILSSLTTFLNPKEKANDHLLAGNNYDSLLTKARIFWTVDCVSEFTLLVLTEKLKDLESQKDKLNRECLQIPTWAYKKGKKGIEQGEASYGINNIKSA